MKTLLVIPTIHPGQAAAVARAIGPLQGDVAGMVVTNGARPKALPELPPGWRGEHTDEPGLLSGRHFPLFRTDADILVYLDDDIAVPDGWLARITAPFLDASVQIVGCRYLPQYAHEPPAWMDALWYEQDGFRTLGYLSLLDGGTAPRLYSPMLVWGLCFAARRETVIKLGGFHPDGYPWLLRRYRGDGENGLCAKAQRLGMKAFYQGETHVMHSVPAERMTWRYFERRAYLQAISDGYAEFREKGSLPAPKRLGWRSLFSPLRTRMLRARADANATVENIGRLIGRAYMDGQNYYRAEVRDDPQLRAWISQPDYLTAGLRAESWQS